MKPSPSQLSHCLAMLTRFIPPPPRPKVREQKSKWGLKVGDRLSNQVVVNGWEVSTTSPDHHGTVIQTDSLGVIIEFLSGKVARIETREALESYHKQPRPRRSRGKRSKVPGGGAGTS